MNCVILDCGKNICRSDWSSVGTKAEFYKLYYGLDGKSVYTCNGKQAQLLPGQLYIIQENTPYRIVTEPNGFFEALWFHVDYFLPLKHALTALDIRKKTC